VNPLSSCVRLLFLLLAFSASAQTIDPTAGAMIFRKGILPDGQALRGEREANVSVEGAAAACVNCHRHSGLGAAEGQTVIAPITGKYLFRPNGQQAEDMDFRYLQRFNLARDPYPDEAGVARAIREGVGRGDRQLNYLMPRFKLNDESMASLIAYLKTLSKDVSPGVSGDTLHFATIITPDADPVARRGMLQVMEQFITDKNEFIRGGVRPMRASGEFMYRVSRRWQLHVWELSGPPNTWEKQLHEHLAAEPVFAVISGLGGKTWEPVHRFCEQEAIPCLLPNVDLPVVAESDFYPLYFSKGVVLEAQLISHQLHQDAQAQKSQRLVQVYRQGDIGADASRELAKSVSTGEIANVNRVLPSAKAGQSGRELARALESTGSGDAIMLWLRPDDLKSLPDKVPAGASVFVSGSMADLEQAPLPAAWRRVARMAYPYDLPDQRKVRMNFPLGWFKVRHIPVVAERVQSDTYLAMGVLSEAITHMLESFYRDYLVERIENMLSAHQVSGYYPRFGLAPGQRFASKGGYVVHFADPDGPRLVADSEWVTP